MELVRFPLDDWCLLIGTNLIYLIDRMAKSVKSDKWFVRIDGNKEFITDKVKTLSQQIDIKCLLAAYHLGEKKDNPHCHICVETHSTVQKQSFALRIKSLFGIEKKTQYALQPWDGDHTKGAVSYLFHEDTAELIFNKGFSESELSDARLANEAVQRVVKMNKEKASGKLVEKAYEYCEKELKHFNAVDCLVFMLDEIKQGNHYHPGDFMLRRYLQEIEVRMSDDLNALAVGMLAQWYKA